MDFLAQPITLSVPLAPDPGCLDVMRTLLTEFEDACDRVREVATEHNVRHQVALHGLVYRQLYPKRTPRPHQMPSQYAIRAISRVSHQLRCESLEIGDPYPNSSIDLDARTFAADIANHQIQITSFNSVGTRGQNAKFNRLAIPARFPKEDLPLWLASDFLGGHLIIPPKGRPLLIARLRPKPESVEYLREALLDFIHGLA